MIKDITNSNEAVLPNTKQIEVLKENFPACFKKMEAWISKDSKNI